MDKIIDLHTKTALSKLVSEVEQGGEIVIARAGKPVAKLVPVEKKKGKAAVKAKKVDRTSGFMKGQIKILKGFYDPLPADMLAAMMGGDD
jgi:prevent-host-death family protein